MDVAEDIKTMMKIKANDNGDLYSNSKIRFKEIENMDYDLDDFVKFISEKSGKSADDTIKQAIKHTDKVF